MRSTKRLASTSRSTRPDLVRAGVPEQEARRRAHMHFGSREQLKHDCRRARGLRVAEVLERVVVNVRLAVPDAAQDPGRHRRGRPFSRPRDGGERGDLLPLPPPPPHAGPAAGGAAGAAGEPRGTRTEAVVGLLHRGRRMRRSLQLSDVPTCGRNRTGSPTSPPTRRAAPTCPTAAGAQKRGRRASSARTSPRSN